MAKFMVKLIFLNDWLGKNLILNDLTKSNCSISFCASFVFIDIETDW